MLFNSLEFLIFLPIVVAGYFALNHKYRWILLLIASYYFYMSWNYKYAVLIAFTTIINYTAGIGISQTKKSFLKNLYLIIGVVASLSVLFFFKYFNFFGESVNSILRSLNMIQRIPRYNFLLPVGISFYTFQTLSYTIDVYFGKQKVEYHLGIFALYVSFFPQLVAGPIERSTNLLPQFFEKHNINYQRIRDGIFIMLWGYIKKVAIADRLSEYVNIVYNNPSQHEGWIVIIATFFFAIQIYCDFSGYSDIAIGTAKIMGFDLMTNFRRPYFSQNIREFWQRWHISLSTWFRDYLYIPLGGNRVSKLRNYLNLFITFVVSGLWHGANWTFVIWGALHGFYLIFAKFTVDFRQKINQRIGLSKFPSLNRLLNILITFIMVYFAWIFFRANSISDAWLLIGKHFTFHNSEELNLFRISSDFNLSFISIAILILVDFMEEQFRLSQKLLLQPASFKWSLLIMLLGIIFIFGVWDEADFLYFQF